jgi:hypothetical protein
MYKKVISFKIVNYTYKVKNMAEVAGITTQKVQNEK